MVDELTHDPVEKSNKDPERLQAIVMCFAELVACIPTHEYVAINDEIMTFYDQCVKRGTQGYYIDLIQYYCQNTLSNYERHAMFYT